MRQFATLVVVLVMLGAPGWARDRDNNPPGRCGGAGTNWENPPGWRGGAGAGPRFRDPDGNPPGRLGGRGTNWERWGDRNPPGRLGGRGTNWENKPGPRGGWGASPNVRRRCR